MSSSEESENKVLINHGIVFSYLEEGVRVRAFKKGKEIKLSTSFVPYFGSCYETDDTFEDRLWAMMTLATQRISDG